MKIALILEAINRWTGPVDAARRSVEKLGGSVRAAGERIMTMRDYTRDAAMHFRKLAGEEGIARAQRSIGYLKRQVSGLTGAFTLMKYATGAALVGLGEEFVRGVFKAGGEVDQMMVSLTRLEGGADKARQAMSFLMNFGMGQGSRFEMTDIFKAYQLAKEFGMNPQGGSLGTFADVAAMVRVPLGQVMIAIKDAMEGTSTRPLANLGIKMKQGHKAGDPNTYLYTDLAGRWQTETSAKTPEATLEKVLSIFARKYGGMASAQAKTLPGAMAQLHNMLFAFQARVASSGVMDWALKRLNQFFAFINKASKDGSLDRWAKQISNFITGTGDQLITFFQETDWTKVGKDLKAVGEGLKTIAGALKLLSSLGGGGLDGLINVYVAGKIAGLTTALIGLAPAISAVAMTLFGLDIAAAPIAIVIGIVGVLAFLGYFIWKNWDPIKKFFSDVWDWIKGAFDTGYKIVVQIVDAFLGLPGKIMGAWSGMGDFFRGIWENMHGGNSLPLGTITKSIGQAARGDMKGAEASLRPGNVNDNQPQRFVFEFKGNNKPDQMSVYGSQGQLLRRGAVGGSH